MFSFEIWRLEGLIILKSCISLKLVTHCWVLHFISFSFEKTYTVIFRVVSLAQYPSLTMSYYNVVCRDTSGIEMAWLWQPYLGFLGQKLLPRLYFFLIPSNTRHIHWIFRPLKRCIWVVHRYTYSLFVFMALLQGKQEAVCSKKFFAIKQFRSKAARQCKILVWPKWSGGIIHIVSRSTECC